ncbi:GIY-YIG nuclease family protein [Aciduricibacillus chroicocephali]|uniref:GIY-YIG nuclease family protein n=1 Tax=Aciduricibacillus chroicocephali TaxID=3054939 RepID=A0ABY9KVC5_9BACI|nr:GIY-YIG nuclease family protein [Bacillaceae bacterium 44XB]
MGNEHIVYMLICNDQSLYTGYTNDMDKRLHMHNSGKGAKYTRGRGPCRVVYQEYHETKEAALKREYAIKRMPRKKKVGLIARQLKEVTQNASSKKLPE